MDGGVAGEDRPRAVAVVEVEIDDEDRRREPAAARLGDRRRDVVDGAEALAAVAEGMVQPASQVDREGALLERQADGEDGAARHRPLGGEHAVGERVGKVEAEDGEERPGLRQRLEVDLVVDAAELPEGGGLRGVDAPPVGQPLGEEEGEDALAAQRVDGARDLELVGAAVDQVDPPSLEPAEPAYPAAPRGAAEPGGDPAPDAGQRSRRGAGGNRRIGRLRSGARRGTAQPHPGRPPAAGLERRVAERLHPRIARQEGAHHPALGAGPLAVDDAQVEQTGRRGGVEIGEDDVVRFARREAVEVEDVGRRQLDRRAGLGLAIVGVVAHPRPGMPPLDPTSSGTA